GRSDRCDSAGKVFDEVFPTVRVPCGESFDLFFHGAAFYLLWASERERVYLDDVVDYELHPSQADSFDRQPPPSEGRIGGGQVDHQLDREGSLALPFNVALFEGHFPRVDPTL